MFLQLEAAVIALGQHISFPGGEGTRTSPFVCPQHVSPDGFECLDRPKPRTRLISF